MNDIIRRLREKHRNEEGFTLIELLVVVVIIGVLVAIAVPVYLSYREGAADRSAQSDVRGAISAVEQYYTDNSNAYPTDKISQTSTFALSATSTTKVSLSTGTTLTIKNGTTGVYTICAKNSGGSGKTFRYNNSEGGSVAVATGTITPAACA